MSTPSNWPLPAGSVRYLVPKSSITELSGNPLSLDLYPIAFGYYQKARKHKVSRLSHTDYLLVYCVEGCGNIEAGSIKSKVVAGDVMLLPKYQQHHYSADENNPWSIYWAHLDGQLCSEFNTLCGFSQEVLIQPLLDKQLLMKDFEDLLALRHQRPEFKTMLYASNIMRKILSAISLQTTQSHNQSKASQDMQALVHFMQDNLHRSLSLQEISEVAGVSKYYLVRKFQQHMGIAPLSFFLELKIKQACVLLDRSNDTVRTIAEQLGYEDPYYFSRLFKKVMGLSPKQYRFSRHGH